MSKIVKIIKMLVRSCFLITLIKCLKGHKSLGHSVMSKAKVSDWVSEWQGHRNWPIYGWRNTRPGCDTESWEQCKELTWTRLRGNQQLHQDPSKRKGKRLTRWWDRPLRIDELKRQLTVCQWKLSRIAAGCQEEESCWERLHQSFQSVNQWKGADVKNNKKMQFLEVIRWPSNNVHTSFKIPMSGSCPSQQLPQIKIITCPANTIVTHWIVQFSLQVMSLPKLGPKWSAACWALILTPGLLLLPRLRTYSCKDTQTRAFPQEIKVPERWKLHNVHSVQISLDWPVWMPNI